MNNKKTKKSSSPPLLKGEYCIPELIAPAGNLEKMKIAFAFGADAVYLGIPDFSLRARVNDFTLAGIKEAVLYARSIKKKVYVTINIFAHNKHLDKLPKYVRALKKIKPDGLIISDPGAAAVVKKIWPSAKLHLSTQANCINWQAAKFWQAQGFKRIVLGRETAIDEVKKIKEKNKKLEIETFVHGAMCMAYSGRCFLSKYFTGRSANEGDCVQPCRWRYNIEITNSKLQIPNPDGSGQIQNLKIQNNNKIFITPDGRKEMLELVEEDHGSYILNSEDLCLIKRIPEMIDAGISSFKIEGRAKSVYYLACVVGAYRKAIDEVIKLKSYKVNKVLDDLFKELDEKLFNRGFTEGFMFGDGQMAQNLENSHNAPEWEFCGQICSANPRINANQLIANNAGTRRGAFGQKQKYKIFIKVHNTIKAGDQIEIVAPGYDIIKMKVKNMKDAKTGEEIKEAHGGQERIAVIKSDVQIPEYSMVRRKLKQNC